MRDVNLSFSKEYNHNDEHTIHLHGYSLFVDTTLKIVMIPNGFSIK